MPRLRFVSTVQGVSTIELSEPIITIGRVANNVVCIEDPNISKHHTLLVTEDDTYKIYDLHSVNGTWVNGERVTVAKLKEGDAVRIGYLELKYEIATPITPAVVPAAPRPVPVAPLASKSATGPSALSAPRPKLGLKPTGPSTTPPVVVPAAHSPTPSAAVPPPAPAPISVNEEPRSAIELSPEKKITGPATPPPAPVAAKPLSPTIGGPPKMKPLGLGRPPAPAPAAPTPDSTVPSTPDAAATVEATAPPPVAPAPPAVGPKKLGGAPGGGPTKFKLKRE